MSFSSSKVREKGILSFSAINICLYDDAGGRNLSVVTQNKCLYILDFWIYRLLIFGLAWNSGILLVDRARSTTIKLLLFQMKFDDGLVRNQFKTIILIL